MNKKVSIIIPVYNTKEFLSDCIKSVLKQSYDHLEIIVINDGSNLACRERIEEMSSLDKRINVYHFSEQQGVGKVRNYGISVAKGDYIYFLDSDDYLTQNSIELLVNTIGDYPFISGKINNFTVPVEETNDTGNNAEVRILANNKMLNEFDNMTVVHRLFKKDFIMNNKLRFSEDTALYTDLPFLVSIINTVNEVAVLKDSLYYKRERNDPILNPSLSQSPLERNVEDFIEVYTQQKDRLDVDNSASNRYLDDLFLNYYRRQIVMFLDNKKNVDHYFSKLSATAKKVDRKRLKEKNIIVRTQINMLIRGNKGAFSKTLQLYHGVRKVKWAFGGRTKLFIQLYRTLFMRLPLKERTIVFESFLGKNYSDSPKYIYEYMKSNNYDYKYVWIFNEPNKEIPGNPKQIKRFSLPYYYYLATSKYWVSNSRMPKSLTKRKGNVYLQTWHGTPLKRLVFDMNDIHSANPNYKKIFYEQSRRWDYLISPNQYSSDIFKSAFLFEKKLLEVGYPRNDILYREDKAELANSLKQKLGIPLDKKVILYAPTWRDDDFYEPGKYKFQLQLNLKQMKERLGDEYVVILRMHYFIADHIETTGAEGFAYNYSKYDDIAELYLISDILITDYSSVFFDFANLKRPILFYTYDLEKYRDTLRGFYIDVEEEVPGPLLKTSEDVIEAIENIEEISDQYKEKYDVFYEKFCNWDEGNASEKVVKQVFH